MTTTLLGLAGWCVAAALAAGWLGAVIRAADGKPAAPVEDVMDALPCDCVDDGEIERRFARIVGWVR